MTDDKPADNGGPDRSVTLSTMSSMRRVDPFGVAALAAAGTLAGHELGYLAESGDGGVSHAYLGALGPIIVLALCTAAWIGAVRVLRRDSGRPPSFAMLAGVQIGVFAAMEVGERVTTGSASSLLSVPVILGLVVQPLVAWAALRLLATGRRIIEALFVRDAPSLTAATFPLQRWTVETPITAIVGNRLRVRGPPVV